MAEGAGRGGGGGGGGGTGSQPPSPPPPLEIRSCRAVQYRGNITLLPSFILRSPAETSTLILHGSPVAPLPLCTTTRASKLPAVQQQSYTSRPLCFNNTVYIGTRSIDLFARRPARVHVALKDGHIGCDFETALSARHPSLLHSHSLLFDVFAKRRTSMTSSIHRYKLLYTRWISFSSFFFFLRKEIEIYTFIR